MEGSGSEERASSGPTRGTRGRRIRRTLLWTFRGLLLLVVLSLAYVTYLVSWMPGKSYRGPLPELTPAEAVLRDELRRDVERLAAEIGERHVWCPQALGAAAEFIAGELGAVGFSVERQAYDVLRVQCENLIVERRGAARPEEILVVGAHYDTVPDCPGANDNGSAVAALLALARRYADRPTERTLRFVAFVNEEPPFFQTDDMGSLVYARRCRERAENIVGMIALETMGYYCDEPGSQQYPPPFSLLYPSAGNFIAFVGDFRSRRFVHEAIGAFREHARFPSEGGALPGLIAQAGWSDHWSFWQVGYPGLMVTDTAPFRYPHYHTPEDTPDQLDYARLARVVAGLEWALEELVGVGQPAAR